jgi:hypothetical protein
LVHELTVDITPLRTFNDAVHVRDIPRPAGVTILTREDEVVAKAQPPRAEEPTPEAGASEAAAVAAVEVAAKKPGAAAEGHDAKGS